MEPTGLSTEQCGKILMFLKRREGMSVAAFRDYYETVHAPLCEHYLRGVTHYIRRYIDPLPNPVTGETEEPAFDVITELWFEDETLFRGTVEHLSNSPMPGDVIEDEKKLFDRVRTRVATVVEHATPIR